MQCCTTAGALARARRRALRRWPETRAAPAFASLVEGMKVSYGIPSVRYYVLMGTPDVVQLRRVRRARAAVLPRRRRYRHRDDRLHELDLRPGHRDRRLPAHEAAGQGDECARACDRRRCSWERGRRSTSARPDLRVIAFGALFWGLVIGATEPLLRTLMQSDAPAEYVGRVMGTAQVHRSAGEIVPLAFAPGLAAAFGVQPVMIAGVAVRSRRGGPDHTAVSPPELDRGRSRRAVRCASTRRSSSRRSDQARSPDRGPAPLVASEQPFGYPQAQHVGHACYSDRDILWFRRRFQGALTNVRRLASARAK